MRLVRGTGLLQYDRYKDRRKHQEDPVIPSMLFCYDQLNSHHVLETSQTCCDKRHDDEKDQ